MDSSHTIRVDHGELEGFCMAVFERLGVAPNEAAIWADVLVQTSLRGVDSHGILVLPMYAAMIEAGGIKVASQLKIISDAGPTTVLDGGHGIGQVIASQAMDMALDRAQQFGLSLVTVRNSNHFGRAGFYAAKSLSRDMLGMAVTNAGPALAAWGGKTRVIGSNALAIAVPAGKELPIIFDTAAGAAAAAKIFVAAERGERIPADWMLDRDGKPTEDPNALFAGGMLLPFGKHKGYGFGVIMDVLTGVLSGGLFGANVRGFGRDMSEPLDVCQTFCALNIENCLPASDFKARMDEMIAGIKRSEPIEGVDRVYLPGEQGFITAAERKAHGIPIWEKLAQDLRSLAHRLSVALPC
jgi:LDH2 family malate/lactate/ureidoglycolate dehydrogenase